MIYGEHDILYFSSVVHITKEPNTKTNTKIKTWLLFSKLFYGQISVSCDIVTFDERKDGEGGV